MIRFEQFKTYQKNIYVRAAAAILLTLAVALVIRFSGDSKETTSDTVLPAVTVTSAAELSQGDSISLIGSVRAFTEAQITTERSGRVTSVSAELGGRVSAGQIIATLENASEQAAVLQAQGAYEAALAASAQSGVGVGEASTALLSAKNNAVNTYRSAYSTVNGAIFSNMDSFFSNPNGSVPGLKIDGAGQTQFLNNERVAFQSILPTWQQRSSSINANSNLQSELAYAKTQTERTIAMVDTFISIFNQSGSVGGYSEVELQTLSANFTALKSSLIATRSSLDGALSGIASAEDAVKRAEIAASGGTVSASDAQVKQALGSLRAAQANLAKTVLRSPIAGTVNSLNVKLGDFVNSFDTVSIIANNNALEIVTFVGDNEKDQLVVGDVVIIEGEYQGIITQIAPAVDDATKKTEVRIATDNTNIANGDTVRISKESATSTVQTSAMFIPITAVKFEADSGYVFVVENDTLVSRPVTFATIRGSKVEILEGLSMTDRFVTDARGLSAGTKVQVTNQ